MSQTDAARTFGVSLQAVNTWMRLDREGSLRVLTLNRRRRHSGEYRLSAKRAAVASLTARDYGIAVSLVTVGRYLRAWGLSPQTPVQHAYERSQAAITWWLKQVYPTIARQAKREHTAIY
jgi:transposase